MTTIYVPQQVRSCDCDICAAKESHRLWKAAGRAITVLLNVAAWSVVIFVFVFWMRMGP